MSGMKKTSEMSTETPELCCPPYIMSYKRWNVYNLDTGFSALTLPLYMSTLIANVDITSVVPFYACCLISHSLNWPLPVLCFFLYMTETEKTSTVLEKMFSHLPLIVGLGLSWNSNSVFRIILKQLRTSESTWIGWIFGRSKKARALKERKILEQNSFN